MTHETALLPEASNTGSDPERKGRPSTDAKERILDAAERLFADHGFDATSLRMITAQAGVNLAAVNYHFQSKDALIKAVFARRIGQVNQERLRMLDECETAAGTGPLHLECILRAFAEPVLRAGRKRGGAQAPFARLLGRMYTEPAETVREVLFEQMREIATRFAAAFHRALPGVPQVELLWRINFCVGVLAHSLAGTGLLQFLSDGQCDPTDVEGMIARIVTFLGAGLRAPVVSPASRG